MTPIKPTRMELLKIKKRIKLAEKGYKLLKQKRDVLVMEFFSTLREIKQIRSSFAEQLNQANKSLFNAVAIDGSSEIQRASLGLTESMNIFVQQKRVRGINISQLSAQNLKYQWPGYFDQSIEFDYALVKYRSLLPDIIKLTEKQLALKKLGEEIRKTKRRVNALEYIVIPKLHNYKKSISLHLQELERDNFARLKIIKMQKENEL